MTIKKILPFLTYTILVSTALYNVSAFSFLGTILFVLFGYGTWLGFEYVFHRFAFHNPSLPRKWRKILAHGHSVHHKSPNVKDDLILPLHLTLPLSLVCFFTVWGVFGFDLAACYYLGLGIGYFVYESVHYAAHHLKWGGIFKLLRVYHLKHHHQTPHSRFMVSNPILDYMFRSHK